MLTKISISDTPAWVVSKAKRLPKYAIKNLLFALCCVFCYILLWGHDRVAAPASTIQTSLSSSQPADESINKSNEPPAASLVDPHMISEYGNLTEHDLRIIQLLKRKKNASSSLSLIIGSPPISNQSTSPPQEPMSLWSRPEGTTKPRHRCYVQECRFIFAGDIAEQLSASSFHMDQIAHLAAQFARVLVLPRVGSSRFHVCKAYPFSTYFEPTSYDSVPGLEWIHEDEFFDILAEKMERWNEENEADHVEFEQDEDDLPSTYITTEHILFQTTSSKSQSQQRIPTWSENKQLKCHQQRNKSLKKGALAILPGSNPIAVMVAPSKTEVDISRSKLRKDVFALGERWRTIDVVLVTWKWQEHILFPDVGYFTEDKTSVSMLQYSSELWAQAYRAASLMRPYATVHWRMELTDPEWMPSCAEALVQFLESEERSNSTVFLANDLPVDGHPASGTFRNPDVLHVQARDHLASQIGRLKTWRSLGLDGIASVSSASSELPDNGLLGIIDKLIASLSDEFIGGPKYCSRSGSSYTRSVASMRELVRNRILAFPLPGDNAPFVPSNVISHWPIPSFKEKRAALEALKKDE